jgi:endonuclease-3 related protein
MSESGSAKIRQIVRLLNEHYGEIRWWPGDADEVMIGAVLTQQTRWENVERALGLLRDQDRCTISGIHHADSGTVEDAIRCTGFYRVKTQRLKALAAFIVGRFGTVGAMDGVPTGELRRELLGVHGIGEETADSILCYALHRPSFVIDAYTHRICACMGISEQKGTLKSLFEANLPDDEAAYRRCHAHIVEYYKGYCSRRKCETCILKSAEG